jgi:hypothetical protein
VGCDLTMCRYSLQTKTKATPVIKEVIEEGVDEEDLNVTSSDQPPSIVSSPIASDAFVLPKSNVVMPVKNEESEEPEPEPEPQPQVQTEVQPETQPKKPGVVVIPATSPARSGAVRRGRVSVNRKVLMSCAFELCGFLCVDSSHPISLCSRTISAVVSW